MKSYNLIYLLALLTLCVPAQASLWWDGSSSGGIQAGSFDLNSTHWSTAAGGTALVGFSANNDLYFNGNNTSTISLSADLSTGTGRLLINGDTGATGSTVVNYGSAQTLTVGGSYFGVGWSAAGTFNQSGGTISASAATLNIGRFSANGTYNMTGGMATFSGIRMANVGTAAANNMLLNINGGTMQAGAVNMAYAAGTSGNVQNGTITVTSGALTVTDIQMSHNNYNNDTINLNGGVLTANSIAGTAGTGQTSTFHFNGGTLKVGSSTVNFMDNVLTAAYVDSGGAKIDINGKTSTIAQVLSHGTGSPDGGLTLSDSVGGGTLTLGSANTYTGNTDVQSGTLLLTGSLSSSTTLNLGNGGNSGKFILGGAGGAVNQAVAGLTTTGTGTDNAVVGGNASVSTLTASIASGNNAFGGVLGGGGVNENSLAVTKSGNGTLTLSGANTYSGTTTISAGTLALGSTTAIGTGTLTITGGSLDSAVANLVNANVNVQNWNGDFTFVGTQNLNLGTGAVTLNATRQVTVTANTLTVCGAIDGVGFGLTKAGAGILTLSGASTYGGTTTIGAGTLALSGGNDRLPTTGTVAFSGAGTLDVGTISQTLANVTVANGITGTVTGSGGTLTLNGNSVTIGSTAASTTTLDMSALRTFAYANAAGTFGVQAATTTGAAGALTLATTNTVTANVFESNPLAGITATSVVHLGQTNAVSANTIKIGGNGSGKLDFRSGLTGPYLTLRDASGGATAIMQVGISGSQGTDSLADLTGGSVDIVLSQLQLGIANRGSSGAPVSPTVRGTFSMQSGTFSAGTLLLGQMTGSTSGYNPTGIFNLSGGTAKVSTLTLGDKISTSANTLTATFALAGGATLNAATIQAGTSGTGGTITRSFNWNDGTIKNYDASTDLTIGAGPTWTIAGTGTHTFDIEANRTATVNATLAGASGALTKTGAGSATLTVANSYGGGTTLNNGTLSVSNVGGLGSGGVTFTGGTLSLAYISATPTIVNTLGVANGQTGYFDVTGSGGANNTLTVGTGTINIDGTLRFTRAAGNYGGTSFSAAVTGGGTLELGNTQGGIAIDSSHPGRAQFTNVGAFSGFTGSFHVLSGGNLSLFNATQTTSSQALTIDSGGYVTISADATTQFGGLNGGGSVTMNSASGHTATLSVGNGGGSGSFDGVIAQGLLGGSGTVALIKTGAGAQIMNGTSTYTGATDVQNGTLQLTGSLSTSTTLNLGNGSNSGKFVLGGAGGAVSQTVAGLTTTGSGTANAVVGGNASVSTLTANIASGNNTFGGALGGVGASENSLALTKSGAGTLTLSGASTYAGSTTISAGTLALSGGDNRLATSGTVNFSGNSAFSLTGVSQTLANVTVANGVTGTITGSQGELRLTGASFLLAPTADSTTQVLSLSGLSNFTYANAAGTFLVNGASLSTVGSSTATLTLSPSSIITASTVGVGNYSVNGSGGNHDSAILNLGANTVINANTIQVGVYHDSGTIHYLSGTSNPVLTLRGNGGALSRVTTMEVGKYSPGEIAPGMVDLTSNVSGASTLDALIGTLYIGYQDRGASSGSYLAAVGNFTMGAGTLDATTIVIGRIKANGTTTVATGSATTGTLTVGAGGLVKVGTLMLGDHLVASGSIQSITATFNLNDGAMLNAQSITAGADGNGTVTRTFNWNDGTIRNYDASTDLTIGAGPAWTIAAAGTHTFDIDSGRTATVNATLVGAGGTLTKTGSGTLVLSTNNTYTGTTTVNNGTLTVNGSLTNANIIITGGAVNGAGTIYYRLVGDTADQIQVSGTGTIALNNLTLTMLRSGSQSQLEYVLVDDLSKSTGQFAATNLPAFWYVDYDGTTDHPDSVVLCFDAASATWEWDGNGDSDLWSAETNWVNDTALMNGVVLRFPADMPRAANTNDVLSSVYRMYLEGGYDLRGNGLTVLSLVSNAGVNTIEIPMTNSGALTFDTAAGSMLTLSNALSGAGGPVKTGPGTLALASANSYGGATVVSEGTLQSGANDVLPDASAITVAGNASGVTAALDLNGMTDAVASLTLGGSNATSGATVQTGAGALTVTAGVTFSSANNPLGATISGNLNLGAGTRTFSINDSSSAADDLLVSAVVANGGLTKGGAGVLTLTASNTYSSGTTISAGTLRLRGGNDRLLNTGSVNFTGASTMDVGSISQTLANASVANGVTATVLGSGGTLNLGASTFDLSPTATGATLDLSGLSAFVYNNGVANFGINPTTADAIAATLKLGGANTLTALALNVGTTGSGSQPTGNSSSLYLGQANTICADTLNVGSGRAMGTVVFRSGLTAPTVTIRASDGVSAATIAIGVNNSGANTTPVGTRTSILDLSSGSEDVLAGTVTVGKDSRGGVGTPRIAASLILGSGIFNASTIVAGQDVSGDGAGLANTASVGGTLTTGSGTLKVGTLTIGLRAGGDTVTGTVNLGSGGIIRAQTIQSGSGTATRNFNWNDGTIRNYDASTDLTIGAGPTWTIAATGTHTFDIDSGRTATVSAVLGGSGGTLVKAGVGTLVLSANNTYSGITTVSNGVLQVGNNGVGMLSAGDVVLAGGTTLRFNTTSYNGGSQYGGAISGNAEIVIDGASGSNLMRFNGNNSGFSGTLTVLAGSRASLHAANSGSASARFVVNGTLSGQAANDSTYLLGELSGSGSIGGGGTTTDVNFSVGGLNTDSTFAGIFGSTGGDLTKSGTGTLTLTGVNTYTGITTVNGGTLRVNGTNASAATVNSPATLGGTGRINGLVTVNSGAQLAPGASPGTLTLGNGLLLNDGAVLDFELPGDLIAITNGTFTGAATGQVQLNITASGLQQGTQYTLIDWSQGTANALGVEPEDFVVNVTPAGSGIPHVTVQGSKLLLGVNTSSVFMFR